ncbi:unnamed protein product, partial [marine sediment metagenome]
MRYRSNKKASAATEAILFNPPKARRFITDVRV